MLIFIIGFHEKPKCIIDMICNIRNMNNKRIRIGFCLHISKNFIIENEQDKIILDNILAGRVFPRYYNISINPNRLETKWGSLLCHLENTLEYGISKFPQAKHFVFLASNCLQLRKDVIICNINAPRPSTIDFGFDYVLTWTVKNMGELRYEFLKHMAHKKEGEYRMCYSFHEGMFLSQKLAIQFVQDWKQFYGKDKEVLEKDMAAGLSEEHILQSYLSNLRDMAQSGSLCIRILQGIGKDYNLSLDGYFFAKPIKRELSDPVREHIRIKNGYNNLVHQMINLASRK